MGIKEKNLKAASSGVLTVNGTDYRTVIVATCHPAEDNFSPAFRSTDL